MDGEGGSGIRLSKRFAGGKVTGGSLEVDYKTKAGTAWSHNFLNQKPWHPLSYPNQRRKWIAEQTHAQHDRRAEEVAREFEQEQDFFRQTALISKKDREKVEMMRAVSFMYVRPPGYDAESAKAAEASHVKTEVQNTHHQDMAADGSIGDKSAESALGNDRPGPEKRKPRPKDVFGRSLPTEEEFEVLKNAPKLETGIAGRSKPFGVEVRNVKCLRCGNYGHQSGDRECPLKDTITPNEEVRLKRDDPLSAIVAHIDPSEPLKWELKQKPGLSPPRGGFKADDPNQQIVAEDIYDQYGGFLDEGIIPIELLKNITSEKKKKKSKKNRKHKKRSSQAVEDSDGSSSASEDMETRRSTKSKKHKRKKKEKTKKSKKHDDSDSYSSEDSDSDGNLRKRRQKRSYSSEEHYEKQRKLHKYVNRPTSIEDDRNVSDHHVSKKQGKDGNRYKGKEMECEKHDSERQNQRRKKGKEKLLDDSEGSDSSYHSRDIKSRQKGLYPSEAYPERYRRSKQEPTHSPENSYSRRRSSKKGYEYTWEEEQERDRHQRRRHSGHR